MDKTQGIILAVVAIIIIGVIAAYAMRTTTSEVTTIPYNTLFNISNSSYAHVVNWMSFQSFVNGSTSSNIMLNHAPGINVSFMPPSENVYYGNSNTVTAEIEVEKNATPGTYLVNINPGAKCSWSIGPEFLLTVGNLSSPYNGMAVPYSSAGCSPEQPALVNQSIWVNATRLIAYNTDASYPYTDYIIKPGTDATIIYSVWYRVVDINFGGNLTVSKTNATCVFTHTNCTGNTTK